MKLQVGQVENSDVSDISDISDQIVRVFQVRVFLLALCSNLKTRTSRTKLSDFFFVRTIKFLLRIRRKLGHVGTRKSGLLGRKGPHFLVSKLPNFFAFFKKRNSVSSFYFPMDLLLITVDDIINKTLKISNVNSYLTA